MLCRHCGLKETEGALDCPCRSLESGRFPANNLTVVVFDGQLVCSGPKRPNLPPLRTLSGIISCGEAQCAITEEQF